MKNILKKVTTVLALSLTATFSSGVFASAETLDLTSTPEKTLETYMIAVENQDISKIREYSNDVRNFSNEDYKNILESEKLVDYKVLESEAKDSNTHSFLVESTYDDGLVTEAPVLLKKEGSEWKVSITNDTLTSPENKIIENSKEEAFKPVVEPRDVLLIWNFWDRVGGNTFYSNSTFSVPGVTQLKLGISTQIGTGSLTTPAVTYAIVQKGIFSDTVWGSVKVVGNIYSDKYYTISGNSTKFTNANIRFTTTNTGGTFDGSGGLDW